MRCAANTKWATTNRPNRESEITLNVESFIQNDETCWLFIITIFLFESNAAVLVVWIWICRQSIRCRLTSFEWIIRNNWHPICTNDMRRPCFDMFLPHRLHFQVGNKNWFSYYMNEFQFEWLILMWNENWKLKVENVDHLKRKLTEKSILCGTRAPIDRISHEWQQCREFQCCFIDCIYRDSPNTASKLTLNRIISSHSRR